MLDNETVLFIQGLLSDVSMKAERKYEVRNSVQLEEHSISVFPWF